MTKANAQPQRQTQAPATEPARADGLAIHSPRPERVAQLQSLANDSPQAHHQADHAEMARHGAAAVAQQRRAEQVASSPRVAAQRRQIDDAKPDTSFKANRTGLPDGLKHGIETLSGMCLDDVRVHYNSGQPAQLSALAYAQGRDIHLGPGQERHLPHEAWHVVQQAQGRVRPTMQMKQGVAVNDDDALEQEADTMGTRALQVGRAATPDAPSHAGPTALADTGTSPIQRIATQVTLGDKNTIVVRIVGRPPNAYGSSSGDHLTAFATRQATLVMELGGQNVWLALGRLDTLIGGILELPGVESIAGMAADRRARLIDAWRLMRNLRETLPSPMDLLSIDLDQVMSAYEMSQLQELISTYLDVAELIPLSTINIAAKSKSLAGKGKGESRALALLRDTEAQLTEAARSGPSPSTDDLTSSDDMTIDTASDDEALFEAFLGVFDASAAALVAAELDDTLLTKMGVAFPTGSTPPERVFRMVKHHLVTMYQSFPRVIARLGGPQSLGSRLFHIVFARMRDQWDATIVALDESIVLARRRIERVTQNMALMSRRETRHRADAQADIDADEARIADAMTQKEQIRIYRERYKDKAPATRKFVPPRAGNVVDRPASDDSQGHGRKRSHQEMTGKTEEDDEDDIDEESIEELDDEEAVSLIDDGGIVAGPAVQIRVSDTGGIIDIQFAGRSPSPLIGGGMGAHTTAWIVYLDRIRAALVGQMLDDVTGILQTLWDEAGKSAKRMAGVFEDTPIGKEQRGAATAQVEKALERMRASTDPSMRLSLLQNALRAMLNFQNNVPGATLESADTGGKSEGKHRGVLIGKENYRPDLSQSRVREAIAGLLDLKVMSQDGYGKVHKDAAQEHHKELVSKAYPRAWSFSKGVPYIGPHNASADGSASSSADMQAEFDSSTFDAGNFSAHMLGGEGVSMDITEPEIGNEGLQPDVNPDYQYEDVDMYRILRDEVANLELEDVHVVPPTDNMHGGQLTQRLRDIGVRNPGFGQTATLLVPFNIGNYHWVGILIAVTGVFGGTRTVVRYLDSLGGVRAIAPNVLAEIRAVYPNAVPEDAHRILQIDGTSCGPLTIENLLMQLRGLAPRGNVRASPEYTARLRERHVRLLEQNQPGANFRDRQRHGNTLTSTFDMAGYLKRTLTYTKRGTARILRIAHSIRGLSEAARTPILEAFRQILAQDRGSTEPSDDYALLRDGFQTARDARNAEHDDRPFTTLMRDFWGTSHLMADFAMLQFADYDEMIAIGNHATGSNDIEAAMLDIEARVRDDENALEFLTTGGKADGKRDSAQ